MKLTTSLAIAIIVSAIGLFSWEYYWRSQGYYPKLDDNKGLWATTRAKVDHASENDVVLMGSSRVLFAIQLNEWEQETGVRPIQLALVGSSPLPVFEDVVQNTEFKGTIVIGVTPGLFFGGGGKFRPKRAISHYHDRTYAQRLNHRLSIGLQQKLAMMSATENNSWTDIDLKSLLNRIQFTDRALDPMPPFDGFMDISSDRNGTMMEKYANDTVYANRIKRVWEFFRSDPPKDPPPKDERIEFFMTNAKKFTERGGNIILLRLPSTDDTREFEAMGMPRTEFWDELIARSGIKGYHFEDYEEFKYYDCPEWSHLSGPDAQKYTTDLVKMMQRDEVLTKSKLP